MINLFPFLKNHTYCCNEDIKLSSLIELSNRLPSSTVKKKSIKLLIKLIAKLHLLQFLPKIKKINVLSSINFDEKKKINYLVFSQDLRKRERLYILREKENGKIDFMKIIWGLERKNIQNEISANKVLKKNIEFDFIIPQKIDEVNNVTVLEYELIPKEAQLQQFKPFTLYDIMLKVNESSNLILTANLYVISQTNWWRNFIMLNDYNNFKDYVYSIISKKNNFNLMWCHGDLGSENVFLLNNKYIIIDWEKSSFDAPIITDYLGIALGNSHREIINLKEEAKNHHSLLAFYRKKIERNFSYEEFLLGLIFYIGTNYNLARYLIKNFTFENTIR